MDIGLSKQSVLGSGSPGIVFRNSDNAGSIQITNQYLNYGMSYCVTNLTARSVYVKDRTGVTVEIPAGRGKVEGVICIEITWNAGREQLRSLMQQYDKHAAINEFCRNAAEAIHAYLRDPSNSSPKMRIFIDEDVLLKRNDAIYQPDLDLMLLFVSRLECEHPESPLTRYNRHSDQAVKLIQTCGADALIYAFEAIDNAPHRQHKDKYVFIGKQVYHVPVKHRPGHPECGLVVTRSRSADEINAGLHPDRKYLREVVPFDEAVKTFGLAETVEEARALGDIKLQTEARIAELQYSSKVKDAENVLTKREFEEANLKRDQENGDLKHYRERLKSDEEWAFQREKWRREREKLEQDNALAREKREWERDKATQDAARDEIRNAYEWIKVITGGLAIVGTFLGLSRLKLA